MELIGGPSPRPTAGGPTDAMARRAQDGDRDAGEELFRRVAPSLYAWACLHVRPDLRSRIPPEDLLQETACRAFEGFAAWRPALGTYRAWVFGIARNVLLKALERLARGADLLPPMATAHWEGLADTATSVTRAAAREEALAHLVERLEELPEDERRLLVYRGLEGLSYEQVAELLDLSPDAVAKRWQRLRDRMRGQPKWEEILAA